MCDNVEWKYPSALLQSDIPIMACQRAKENEKNTVLGARYE